MDHEELVRSHFPNAEETFNAPVATADLMHDRNGHWAIYAGPSLGYQLLGRGSTPSEAWANAASRVRVHGGKSHSELIDGLAAWMWECWRRREQLDHEEVIAHLDASGASLLQAVDANGGVHLSKDLLAVFRKLHEGRLRFDGASWFAT